MKNNDEIIQDKEQIKGYIKRPLPLILINLGYLIMPILYLILFLYFYITANNKNISIYQISLLLEQVLVLILFPLIVGIFLIKNNKISWYLVIVHSIFIFAHNIFVFSVNKNSGKIQQLLIMATFQIVTILIIVYFLAIRKQFREIFFNKRLRWWESKARYDIDNPADVILSDNKTVKVKLQDISILGACIENNNFDSQLINKIKFTYENITYENAVKIVWESNNRLGLQFIDSDMSKKKIMKRVINRLKSNSKRKTGR